MYVIYNGIKWHKETDRYWKRAHKEGTEILLHRQVWIDANGEIPEGYHIHHIDRNKDNNAINNLACLTKEEHEELHKDDPVSDKMKKARKEGMPALQEGNKRWRESPEGKEWRKTNWQHSIGMRQYQQCKCNWCGKEYESVKPPKDKTRMFCSRKCGTAERVASGVDNEVRQCKRCGTDFTVNKYNSRMYCGCKDK